MVSFRRSSVWTALSLVGALIGVAGCSAEAGTKASDPTEEAAQGLTAEGALANDDAKDRHDGPRGHRPGGPGGPDHLLMAALHELDLTAAQKTTIQGALEKLAPGPKDHGPRDQAAFAPIIAGVRAGKIDVATVLPKLGAPDRGPEGLRAEVATASQTLHTTLTKEQRRALVDSMSKRRADRRPPPGAPPQGAPPPDEKGERGRGPGVGPGPEGGPLGHMLSGLSLTAAQRTSIDSALAAQRPAPVDREAMKKEFEARGAEMRTRLEGFAADTFDAKAFLTPPADARVGGPMNPMARMVNELAVVVPILDATQRETLAAQLEKGPPASMRPHGGPDHGRGAR